MAKGGKEMEIAIKIAGKVESSFKNALGSATKGLGSIVKAVSAATTAAASAVGAMSMAAVKTGMEFETAMSQVSATMLLDRQSEDGKKAFETLENAARECGASTAFSATEAAEALNYLALAGYDADKAATALPTVLKLAGAGAMELAEASDMVTDSMSALGIEATEENLTMFSDQLAKTASKANTSVAQLGEGILTVGGTAKGLAGGTTELNASLGILADNGIKAAEGGTHLRNMILSLQTARSSDAAALFEQMGLSAYDAEGNMRSLGDVFGDINSSLAGASAEQVNSTLSTIFKQTDLAAARAMLAATADSVDTLGTVMDASLSESGTSLSALGINLQEMAENFDTAATQEEFAAEMLEQFGITGEQAGILFSGLQSVVDGTGNRFEELTGQIEDSKGACEDMYAIQLDNLDGDIKILKSGISDLGISIYKDLNGPLREMTQLGSSMVGELSAAYGSGGLEGMAGAIGGCLSEAVNEVAGYAPQLVSMGVGLLENFIDGITENSGTLAAAAADVLSSFLSGIFTLVPQVILAGIDLITEFAANITAQAPQLIGSGTQAIVNFVNGIVQRLPNVISTALTLVQTLVNSLGSNAPMLINAAVQLVGSLISGAVQMLPQLVQTGIQFILSLAQGLISNLPLILNAAVQIVTNLVTGLVSMLPQLVQGGIQLIVTLAQGIIQNLPAIAQSAVEIIVTLATGLIQAIPQLVTAIPELISAIVDTIFTTDWLQVGIDIIKGIIDGIMSTGKGLWNAIKSLFTGGGEDVDASSEGAAATESFASGISGNAQAVSGAVSGLSANAFSGLDNSAALNAGTQAGAAFTDGLHAGMGGAPIDTGMLPVDTSGLELTLTEAGTNGAAAVGNGMAGNSQAVTQAATLLGTGVNSALDSGWNKTAMSAQTAMQRLSATVTNGAHAAANAVKAAFENMTITIPKPRIPVIEVASSSVSYGDGGNVNIPTFSVKWNAAGGIFSRPTIFGTSAGMQGVGEAGAEAILPLDVLWSEMREILNNAMTANSGTSLAGILLEKLKGIGSGGGRNVPEAAGAGGPNIVWNPTYNLYGSAGKEEITEADHISRAEFARLMKEYEKDRRRRNL